MHEDDDGDQYAYDYAEADLELRRLHETLEPERYRDEKVASAQVLVQQVVNRAEAVGYDVEFRPPNEAHSFYWIISAGRKAVRLGLSGYNVHVFRKGEAKKSEPLRLEYDPVSRLWNSYSGEPNGAPKLIVQELKSAMAE